MLVKSYEVHNESTAGISVICELNTKSDCLRNAMPSDVKGDFRLLVTASAGSNIFRLWKVDKNLVLHPYLQIKTGLDGIKYIVEMTETQLIAANEKTIKVFNFIDKNGKDK